MNWKYFIKSIEKNNPSKYKIYALIINEDIDGYKSGDVIYVGITSRSLGSRRSGHLCTLGYNNISIVLIENTDDNSRESYYINLFRSIGCNLLNKISGISEKVVIEKISDEDRLLNRKNAMKKYYLNNKEKLRKNMEVYQDRNKDKLREYRKERYLKLKQDKLIK